MKIPTQVKINISGEGESSLPEVSLFKVETRSDAEIPQEHKYPSGSIIASGILRESPTINKSFRLYSTPSGTFPIFNTSVVEEIISKDSDSIEFKTTNSIYIILLNPDDERLSN